MVAFRKVAFSVVANNWPYPVAYLGLVFKHPMMQLFAKIVNGF